MSRIIYRGFEVERNYKSINGTGATLARQRGWNLYLPGYGRIGWEPSMAEIRKVVDSLRDGDCGPRIRIAIAVLDAGSVNATSC